MDDVDQIILITIKDLGCELNENITGVKDFDCDMTYEFIISYLRLINENKINNLPTTLPKNMSARVNTCSLLSNIIKEMGYRSELSYHQILYPNVGDTRKIFTFLGQNLPKKVDTETKEGRMKLEDQIALYFQNTVKESWIPYFCPFSKRVPGNYSTARLFTTTTLKIPSKGRQLKNTPGLEEYYLRVLPVLSKQVNRFDDIAPSVFEYNLTIYADAQERDLEWNSKGSASGLNPLDYKKNKAKQILSKMNNSIMNDMNTQSASGSSFGGQDSFSTLLKEFGTGKWVDANQGQFNRKKLFTNEHLSGGNIDLKQQSMTSEETEEERQAKRQEELDQLQSKLNEITDRMQQFVKEIEQFASMMRQVESENVEQDQRRETLEKTYKLKKKTFGLLDDAEGNMKELQGLCNQTSQNLVELSMEWEKVRQPIVEKYRSIKDKKMNQQDEAKSKIERIKEMSELIKKLVHDIQQREEHFSQLQEAYKTAPKDTNRSIYTRRIMESVKNIKKQKVDIDKVLLDTKALLKEINTITDSAYRSHEVIKDLLSKEDRKDPLSKQVVRVFSTIESKFEQLYISIDETGQFRNNILNLNSKIDHSTQKSNTLNMDRLVIDLKNVKEENQTLIKTIKAKIQQQNQQQ
ncbi:hypothetical protein DLAC_09283 [Tieghemostelium lacteum]|uniref:Coiled-coil domain-containing protein 22 homolog n=1 Tax=Tieghemostelium lacteum TaxID=361077 RepID=A0A151Z9N3_TIELA|nr:hypothetical protein DLAC_09283 [Tieghemostelium lacteum]|eukprot:KYQ90649.1 hypothetical protein DLAC_09283 [Tieghemostelium lacteum]